MAKDNGKKPGKGKKKRPEKLTVVYEANDVTRGGKLKYKASDPEDGHGAHTLYFTSDALGCKGWDDAPETITATYVIG